jgi:hypothetical protein
LDKYGYFMTISFWSGHQPEGVDHLKVSHPTSQHLVSDGLSKLFHASNNLLPEVFIHTVKRVVGVAAAAGCQVAREGG